MILTPQTRSSKIFSPGEIQVLHVARFVNIKTRSSIQKIIENLMVNVPLNQAWLAAYGDPARIESCSQEINRIRAPIVHVHGIKTGEVLKSINYRPFIVSTIHCAHTCKWSEKADALILIHKVSWENNGGIGEIIENTVMPPNSLEAPFIGGSISTMRFWNDCLNEDVLSVYDSIGSVVRMYGYNDSSEAQHLRMACLKTKNVIAYPWNPFVDNIVSGHSLYCYWPVKNNPRFCHGLKVMEAVVRGVPVVTARRSPINKQVVNGFNGYEVDNDEDFVLRCREVLNNSEFRNNAKEYAKRIKNTMPDQYMEVYNRAWRN